MSSTVKAKIRFTNLEALDAAARVMGGKALGRGEHRLFGRAEKGFAALLPHWNYPIVASEDGNLVFESDRRQGQQKDLERFRMWYVFSVAGITARQNRWSTEFNIGSGTMIIRPADGGTLVIGREGVIGCDSVMGADEALRQLEEALDPKPQPVAEAAPELHIPETVPESPVGEIADALGLTEEIGSLVDELFQPLPDEPEAAPEIAPPATLARVKLAICNVASSARKTRYSGRGQRFWAILAETGITLRQLKPAEFHQLEDFGIELVDLAKLTGTRSKKKPTREYDVESFMQRLRELAPAVVAFNGKSAAEAVLKIAAKRIELGVQDVRLEGAQVVVLPSTAAKSHWDPRHWFDLARMMTALSVQGRQAAKEPEVRVPAEPSPAAAAPRHLSYPALVGELAARICDRLVARVVAGLQELEDKSRPGDDSILWNMWDELCDQLQAGRFAAWDACQPSVKSLILAEMERLESCELEALWLQTEDAAGWHEGNGTNYPVRREEIVIYLERQLYAKALDWKNTRGQNPLHI
jgi:TDG/mug DNA glycosylase family protein